MGKVFNIKTGKEMNAVTIHRARTFFATGRKGQELIGMRSLKQKIYRGDFPEWSFTKVNGNYWFDEDYLRGFNNNSAA